MISESLTRMRIFFSKTASIRFTGHLDLQRTWERTFRRAGLPIAYRQGFNPQARLNLALALPLGFTSQCEILDVWFEIPVSISELETRLVPALPAGLEITGFQEIGLSEPALQTQISSAEYHISLNNPLPELEAHCEKLLQSSSIIRQWRDRKYDLRPLILELRTLPEEPGGSQRLFVRLSAREGATGRPEEVASALGISPELIRVHRINLAFLENA